MKNSLFSIILATLLLLGSSFANAELGDSQTAAELKEKRKQWQQAIDDFAKADTDTVLAPYMKIISEMNATPENRWCYPDNLSKLHYAVKLNPSSLLAHSMLFNCATKAQQKQLRKEYLETLNGLINLLVNTKEATSLQNIIEVREMMEAPLLLQAMGYSVLDMDLITRYGGLYYRYHVIDLNTSKVSVRYFSNLQFMKRLLSNPNISDDLAVGLMTKHYLKQQMPFAVNRQAKQLIFKRQYDEAKQLLDNDNSYSMDKKVLYGEIFLATEQFDAFNNIYADLTLDAKSGYIPANIILSRWYLSNNQLDKAQQQLTQVDNFTQQGEGAYHLAQTLLRVDKTDSDIINWYQQAVDAQHPKATFAMAKAYVKGEIVPRDINKTIELYQAAYNLGLQDAGIELVNFYHQGSEQTEPNHQKEMQLLKQLAADENPTAYVMLGKRYANAIDVEQNNQQAFTWFKKAYQLGEHQAANPIAILYERGLISDENTPQGQPNYDMATLWYERAGARGDANGYINLARLALYGLGRDKNIKDAEKYYINAAEAGSIIAYCRLADTLLLSTDRHSDNWTKTVDKIESLYAYGAKTNFSYCPRQLGFFYQNEKIDQSKAQQWFEKGAENGDEIAARMLERIYLDSYLAEDHQKALTNFAHGTRIGLAKSSYYLGKMYHLGLGIKRDDQKALALWQNAASKGFELAEKAIMLLYYQGQQSVRDQAKAEHLLDSWAKQSLKHTIEVADWFFYGEDTPVNYPMAMKFYQRAAADNSARAMNHLGEMYRFGWGANIDYQKALNWYQQAQTLEYIIADHNIAEMYYHGTGVEQNLAKAAQMFRQTASAGITESQYLLGLMHQNGQLAEPSQRTANQWFNIAMGSRHEGAKFMFGKNLMAGLGLEKNIDKGHLLIIEAAEAGYQPAIEFLKDK